MIRLKLIRVFQEGACGPIRVYARTHSNDGSYPFGSSNRDELSMKTTKQEGEDSGVQTKTSANFNRLLRR